MTACELETIDEAATPSGDELEIDTETPPASAPAQRPRRRYLWVLAALLAAACLAAGFFLTGVVATPTRIEPLPFGFQAEQRQDHLLLTWNPAAPAVRGATRATLTIQDGPETEDVELNLAALHSGGLRYYPVFGNVSFRLSLANPSHRTVSEQARLSLRP
ncbi:MAG: hypothetical protein ABSH46_15075 [Bryobacteraceae bacterium]